ncbi:MAG: AMP-binding enzyme [Janthinobacterium lividum]
MTQAILSRASLSRVLRSLLAAELRATRGAGGRWPAVAGHALWPDDLALGEGGLGCDSLEYMSLGAAANEMFHLHETGSEASLLSAERFGDWLDIIEAAWRGGVSRITVTTSGSNGWPKRCAHTVDYLAAEIDALAARWADRRRIVALVPQHHIYGLLFCALLPDRLGVPVLSAEASGAGALGAAFRSGDLLVSFPDRWAFLQRSLPTWTNDVWGVTSTAPCPPALSAGLKAAGLAGLTEVYGSSETAGIALRDDPLAPFRLMPQWVFADPFDPAAPVLTHRSGRDVTMMDRISRIGSDTFMLAGRRDGMVQVGGINVSPTEVAERLEARPGVHQAAVRLMRPDEGSRLKAFLVPEPDTDPEELRLSVESWASRTLSTAERPVAIAIGSALPLNAMGKAADW